MTAELRRFRVENFRSVADSGWIDVDDVTALVGVNESGKTNLLLPLWKLNPAKTAEVDPVADYPRKSFTAIRGSEPKPVFISAVFRLPEDVAATLAKMTGFSEEELRDVTLRRTLSGDLSFSFDSARPSPSPMADDLIRTLESVKGELLADEPRKTEENKRSRLLDSLGKAISVLRQGTAVTSAEMKDVLAALDVDRSDFPKSSTLVPRFERGLALMVEAEERCRTPSIENREDVRQTVMGHIPRFVYYSNYGNLDSEIYLPHVIENMRRGGLGAKDQAKARTLKVLFDFVHLKPEEILELGQRFRNLNRELTPAEADEANKQKKERSVLLQSASTELTTSFREWWKQGDYRFRFEADGGHFRIWVSDDQRQEEIELEGRSSGLQWFLSFYLVFLVERADSHEGAVLLLDEPGLSLHPIAQRDLSLFFDGLAASNQLIYTTHSPFLIDASRLDRVRKVFVDQDGKTKASSDLGRTGESQRGAGYAVHAAVGINVAESLLIGCRPVIVEGPSDQHYLNAIRSVLSEKKILADGGLDLVFVAAGGAKGVRVLSSIVAGRDDRLPAVVLDGDAQGRAAAETLRANQYHEQPDSVICVADHVGLEAGEVEDLIPPQTIAKEIDRLYRGGDTFEETLRVGEPIVRQVQSWAKEQGASLPAGWKVSIAIAVSRRIRGGQVPLGEDTLANWAELFRRMIPSREQGHRT